MAPVSDEGRDVALRESPPDLPRGGAPSGKKPLRYPQDLEWNPEGQTLDPPKQEYADFASVTASTAVLLP